MPYTTLVTTDDLSAHLHSAEWVVFDCRFTLTDPAAGRRAYDKAHIPNARYAHLDDDLAAPLSGTNGRHPLPDPARLAAKLGAWGVGPTTQVVVYDDSFGAMAGRLWWLLRWLGHGQVALLDGGWQKWVREGHAITLEPPAITPARFEARARPELLLDAQAVLAALEQDALIIDARADVRFTGEHETLDPVGGHVPGAVNWPYEDNLDLDGTFLPADELRELYLGVLAGRPASGAIHMCGSGVTACHNLIAMEVAGLPGGKLYPGSWSEWVADPTRPVATGG
ncbi:MAG: sulfurtransferase [Betaproteobacteria bacterium]|nr:sulfurtransferase [Betaproteobacteria bacterium]